MAEPSVLWWTRTPKLIAVESGSTVAGFDAAGPALWCAESAWVRVTVEPPRRGGRGGFALTTDTAGRVTPAEAQFTPEGLTLTFGLPAPQSSLFLTLTWRGRLVHRRVLAFQSEAEYRHGLKVRSGTTCEVQSCLLTATTVVARQVTSLIAAATLTHRQGLLPLVALGVRLDVTGGSGEPESADLDLDGSAARGRSLSIAAPVSHRQTGRVRLAWAVGDRVTCVRHLRLVSRRRFAAAVRVAEAGFVTVTPRGREHVRHPPPRFAGPLGPRFVLACRVGWAGWLDYRVQQVGTEHLLGQGRVLITGRPRELPVGTVVPGDDVAGFELYLNGRLAGTVLARPVPSATFTAEGKFTTPPDFLWTVAAEDELHDRLARLDGPDEPDARPG